MVRGKAAHVAGVKDGARQEIVRATHREDQCALRPPESGAFSRMREIYLRNVYRKIYARIFKTAIFCELLIFLSANCPLTELLPLGKEGI